MKMKKVIAICLTAALTLGISATAFAEEEAYSWTETYSGGKTIDGTFDQSALADQLSNTQPGDTFTLTATIQNTSSIPTNWYMENEVLETLVDAGNQTGNAAYVYDLSYNGETIYTNSTVAGDSASVDGTQGLLLATEDLKDSLMYLDTLETGGTGTVTLSVEFDGEAVDNDFMTTAAELMLAFQVEDASATKTTVYKPGEVITKDRKVTAKSKTVKTGDSKRLLIFCMIALLAGLLLLVMAVKSMRKNRREGGV